MAHTRMLTATPIIQFRQRPARCRLGCKVWRGPRLCPRAHRCDGMVPGERHQWAGGQERVSVLRCELQSCRIGFLRLPGSQRHRSTRVLLRLAQSTTTAETGPRDVGPQRKSKHTGTRCNMPGISHGRCPRHCSRSVGTMTYRPHCRPAAPHSRRNGPRRSRPGGLIRRAGFVCRIRCAFDIVTVILHGETVMDDPAGHPATQRECRVLKLQNHNYKVV